MNELKKMKDLFDDFIKEADKFIDKQKHLELEEENFKINSDGWKKITVDNEEYLENPEKDVWELLSEECRGEQLFTYDSAMRETKKAGCIGDGWTVDVIAHIFKGLKEEVTCVRKSRKGIK